MNKEEQIEEMEQLIVAQIGRTHLSKFVEDENGNLVRSMTIPVYAVMEKLFDANYRKADEVRRGTAMEILKKTKNLLTAFLISVSLDRDFEINGAFEKLAKEYGIEVK